MGKERLIQAGPKGTPALAALWKKTFGYHPSPAQELPSVIPRGHDFSQVDGFTNVPLYHSVLPEHRNHSLQSQLVFRNKKKQRLNGNTAAGYFGKI